MDDLVLLAFLLALLGSAVALFHHDRRSIVRFLPLLGLAVGIGAALAQSPEVAGWAFGSSCAALFWTAGPTSPSLIPVFPILPVLSYAIGAGLNMIAAWLGTVIVGLIHAVVLVWAWRRYPRSGEPPGTARPAEPPSPR